jgi:predicted esterase
MKRSGFPVALLLCATLAGADVYKDKDGKDVITYAANAPSKRLPNSKLGLILGFHGRGGNEKQLIEGAASALQKAGIRDEFVIVGLKSKEDGWTDKDDAPVQQFVPWAIKNWSIDPRRVYGVGFSSGAYYLNKFVPNHSDLFAGAITYVGGQGGLAKTEHPENKSELYWIVGLADQTVKAESVRPNMQAAKAAGYRFVYREIAGMGHEVYKDPPLEDAVQWLKAVRNKEVAPSAEEQAFLDKLSDASKAPSLLGEGSTWLKLAAIGSHAAAPVVIQGLQSDREAVRVHAAQACAKMMFDGKTVEALAALLEDKETRVRTTALQALAFQGRWNYPAAQESLCRLARDAKKPAGERKAAALGLGEVIKFDLLGGYQFKGVGWTLVELLDDEDAGLRQAAFLALQGAKSGVEYSPGAGKPQREAAMAKWTAWCEKVYGAKPAP